MTDTDSPVEAESLLQSLKQAAGGIGFYVNANISEVGSYLPKMMSTYTKRMRGALPNVYQSYRNLIYPMKFNRISSK